MKNEFDIFIPVLPKDFNKLKYLLKSIDQNLTGWKDIHFSTPEKYLWDLVSNAHEGEHFADVIPLSHTIHFHSDEKLIDFDPSRCRHRPNWIRQQYIKMFQKVTSDLYLTVDSDCIFLKPLPMFTEENKRILWMGYEQLNPAYFTFQEKMLGLPRAYPHTFINDMNFMDRRHINEMLSRNGYSVESFIESSYNVIQRDTCYPGEPEIWGQYVMKYHSDKYVPMQCKTWSESKETSALPIDNISWTDEEIEAQIAKYKELDYQVLMLHSWWTVY